MLWSKDIYNKYIPQDTRNNMWWLGYPTPLDPYGTKAYRKRMLGIAPGIGYLAEDTTPASVSNVSVPQALINGIDPTSWQKKYDPNDPMYNTKISSPKWGNDYGSMLTSGSGFLGSMYNAFTFDKSSSDMMNEAGESPASRYGIGYMQHNNIDERAQRRELHNKNATNIVGGVASGAALGTSIMPGWGTAIGAVVGGIGGVIGSLVRSSKYKRTLREALNLTARSNLVALNQAQSLGMLRDWYDKHMNTYDQPLLGAYGLDRGSLSGKFKKFNAMVAPGEIKVDAFGNGKLETGGVYGTDSIRELVNPSDAVLSRKLGYAQAALPVLMYQEHLKSLVGKNKGKNAEIAVNTIKNEINKTQDQLLAITEQQKEDRVNGDIPVGDNFHAAYGLDNLIINGGGALIGLSNLINTKAQKIKNPNTYVPNPYASSALNTLYSLKPVSASSIIKNNLDAEHRAMAAINRSGGLSSSLRMAGYTTIASNSLNNLFKLLADVAQMRNSLKAQAANTALNVGHNIGVERTKANQFDLDYYSKAHAAWLNQYNNALATIWGAGKLYAATADEDRRFNDMYSLYAAKTAAEIEDLKKNK